MHNDLFEFRITSPPSILPLQSLRIHSITKACKAQGKVHLCSLLFLLLLIHSLFPLASLYPATAAQAVLSQFPVLLINFATHSAFGNLYIYQTHGQYKFPYSHLIQDAISVAVCVCVCVILTPLKIHPVYTSTPSTTHTHSWRVVPSFEKQSSLSLSPHPRHGLLFPLHRNFFYLAACVRVFSLSPIRYRSSALHAK